MNPPVCKTCKTAEWRHICGGLPEPSVLKAITASVPKANLKVTEAVVKAAKFDRASYMRERHAKRKANLSSAG